MRLIVSLFLAFITTACVAEPPQLHFEVLDRYAHDPSHFTQGLLFHAGQLYESTGQYGRSQLIRYAEDEIEPRIRRNLEPRYFGEGIAIHNERLYLLTWKAGVAKIFDPAAFAELGSFSYSGEGWGLTSDGTHLWMSNGSAELLQLAEDGRILDRVEVTLDGTPLNRLNELEYVQGWILANRWHDTRIFLIDPQSGEIGAFWNLDDLAQPQLERSREHVLNGIAWHPERETLWITGKNWTEIYELRTSIPARP